MNSFKNSEGLGIVRGMIAAIQSHKDYLSEVDGLIGDGDHGINMNKGFTMCETSLKGDEGFSDSLNRLGTILMNEIGGSMGPLYGLFFLTLAKESQEEDLIDLQVFARMLRAAAEKLQSIGGAKEGDKTLLDSLLPAVRALESAAESNRDFGTALEEMEDAAEKGKEGTKNMMAKIGRSARLGERSIGVLDAGAASCSLLLSSMGRSIKPLL